MIIFNIYKMKILTPDQTAMNAREYNYIISQISSRLLIKIKIEITSTIKLVI